MKQAQQILAQMKKFREDFVVISAFGEKLAETGFASSKVDAVILDRIAEELTSAREQIARVRQVIEQSRAVD